MEYALVTVAQGTLRGSKELTVNGSSYFSFRGIPYAQPPLGPLRFKPPQPPKSWTGVRDALREGSPSLALSYLNIKDLLGSEDCLYLNIYTPELEPSRKRAVMVWIHGGGFTVGFGDKSLFGPDFLLEKDVVLVTINYRLGALGFLSTGDDVIPGNMGLKDQVSALRWIKDNISAFSGNPDNVTIFGESAGGASVNYHTLSPLSSGLFHRAIAMSGSALNPWAFTDSPRDRAFRLGKTLGCDATDSNQLAHFLMTVEAVELVIKSAGALPEEEQNLLPVAFCFVPSVEPPGEGAFLTESPQKLISEGRICNQVPYMTGVTTSECNYKAALFNLLDNPKGITELDGRLERWLTPQIRLPNKKQREETAKKIRQFYLKDKPLDLSTLIQMMSDLNFVEGVYSVAQSWASNPKSEVLLYRFSFKGNLTHVPIFQDCVKLPGVGHTEDICYIFRVDGINHNLDPASEEAQVRSHLTRMWTNFAKYSDPCHKSSDLKWSAYSKEKPLFLDINLTPKLEKDFFTERLIFWRKIMSE